MIPPIYMINLSKDVGRLEAMTWHLGSLSLPFERVEAIYGRQMPDWLKPYFLNDDGTIASTLTEGEVGCYASHLMVLRRVAENGVPALVLEDDLEIAEDFPSILGQISNLPPAWDIVRLSNHYKRGFIPVAQLTPKYQVVKFIRAGSTTGAYLISPKAAAALLNFKALRKIPIDVELRRLWDCKLRAYGIYPQPVRPNIGASTIVEMGGRARRPHRKGQNFLGKAAENIRSFAYDIHWLGLRPTLQARLKQSPDAV